MPGKTATKVRPLDNGQEGWLAMLINMSAFESE